MMTEFASVTRAAIPAVTWTPIVTACAATSTIAIWTRVDAPDHPLAALRLGTLLLAIGLAFAIEDPATEVTAPSPVTFRVRCLARTLAPIAVSSIVWLAAVAAVPISGHDRYVLAADYVAMGLIAAAVAAVRLGNDRPGLVAGPAVFALVLASSRLAILPGDLQIPDGASAVGPARIRLIVIAAIAGAVLIGTTRDPARR